MSFILSHAFVEHRNTEINILHVATKWYLCVVLFETGMMSFVTTTGPPVHRSTGTSSTGQDSYLASAKVDQKKSFSIYTVKR